jgi:cyclic pyranopterin phosphate synthase
MTDRVIPLLDLRTARLAVPPAAPGHAGDGHVVDRLDRPLRDLRISVTDRCNFRCTYCMPKEIFDRDYRFLPHVEVLTFEEITRLARAFIANGVEKIRLTGGEPLLRKDLHKLVEMLARLTTREGRPLDLALTTNGSLLTRKARDLANAGLRRVTVSLDGLDDAVFKRMNDVDFPVADVLAGIDAAAAAGLGPVKINMVVKRGVNDHEIVAMARHFRGSGNVTRFIEFMDVGSSNGWRMDDVVPSAEVIERIDRHVAPLEPIDANYSGEVAERWRYRDGSGEVGVISSVTHAFCRGCTRARLSTEGMLYLCLFADSGYDLRRLLRRGDEGTTDDAELAATVASIWANRGDRYSELRTQASAARPKVEMSYIGG